MPYFRCTGMINSAVVILSRKFEGRVRIQNGDHGSSGAVKRCFAALLLNFRRYVSSVLILVSSIFGMIKSTFFPRPIPPFFDVVGIKCGFLRLPAVGTPLAGKTGLKSHFTPGDHSGHGSFLSNFHQSKVCFLVGTAFCVDSLEISFQTIKVAKAGSLVFI